MAKYKSVFISTLRINGGNVSGAIRASGWNRNAAYAEFSADQEFQDAWLDALEASTDELMKEARRRAKVGYKEPVFHNGKQVATVTKYSDTLLIFLLKQGEAQKKWRQRLVQAGNKSLEAVRTAGLRLKLTDEQITELQQEIMNSLDTVSLV